MFNLIHLSSYLCTSLAEQHEHYHIYRSIITKITHEFKQSTDQTQLTIYFTPTRGYSSRLPYIGLAGYVITAIRSVALKSYTCSRTSRETSKYVLTW